MTRTDAFERIEGPHGWAFVLPEARRWVEGAFQAGLTLREAAAREPGAVTMFGRGPVHALTTEEGRWVVRGYRRGGLVAAPLLGDRYARLGSPRPQREARASAEARRRGVPTPRVLAGAVYPAGVFYRADLITELVEGARELSDVLFTDVHPPREPHLVAAGSLVALMAERGVLHRDLNAKNILLSPGEDVPSPSVLDLDGCRITKEGEARPPDAMLARLERSLTKLGRRTGRPLSSVEMGVLRNAAHDGP